MDMRQVDIKGYEGAYAVTDDGRVWSYAKPCTGCCPSGTKKGRWLSLINSAGYKVVPLGAMNLHAVHRLVAGAFCTKAVGCTVVNHINGDKTDNHVANLEWVTAAENNRHAWHTGLTKAATRLSDNEVRLIRSIYI